VHHQFLPDGWLNGTYKIKTAALKEELEKIQERYPERKWTLGQKLSGFYIAEIIDTQTSQFMISNYQGYDLITEVAEG
jgi:hypothetical protein